MKRAEANRANNHGRLWNRLGDSGMEWWRRKRESNVWSSVRLSVKLNGAVLPLDQALLDGALVPPYQRLAGVAAALRVKGWSDHAIAVKFGVTDKTIAKALRWLRGRSGFQAR